MSIFKSTFPPFVARQLLARQYLLQDGGSSATRSRNVQEYTSGKAAWAKMTSLVNYNGSDELARKYVLEAGTLYPNASDNNQFALRSGVGNNRGSYGGNYSTTTTPTARPLGIRPMPGITSIDIVNKSAYGSLRQATIKFKAWDKPQLDDLEILFLRTGFWVMLEWGWSLYIDTNSGLDKDHDKSEPNPGNIKQNPTDLQKFIDNPMRQFSDPSLDAFNVQLSLENIYNNIMVYNHRFSGNYDALIGMVENFTFELMPDGSYDCTTILISIGDVLDTLKMNRPQNNVGKKGEETAVKTNFSSIMDSFVNLPPYDFAGQILKSDKIPNPYDSNTKVDNTNTYTISNPLGIPNNPKAGANAQKDNSYSYIQFGYLVHIINIMFNLYDNGSNPNKYLNIQIPLPTKGDANIGLCLASVDSVSIDPVNVLIYNDKATFATGLPGGYNPNPLFNNSINMQPFLVENEPKGHSLGYIGNVYVSTSRLKDLFEQLTGNNSSDGKGAVSINTFLNSVLKDMSYALGSINDFGIFVDNNVVTIIDKNYCERTKDTKVENKFKLNILGNNALTRAFKIYSKIFQSQATEIGIAAQARANLGSVYTATQKQFNEGLTNRIYYDLHTHEEIGEGQSLQAGDPKQTQYAQSQQTPNKTNPQDKYQDALKNVANNVLDLRKALQAFVDPKNPKPTFPDQSLISSCNTYLKTILLEINTDNSFRGFIPLSLEVTLDGIGGIVQGQIFTVNKDTLPQEYEGKHLGFVVTALQQHLKGSDWTTVIGTKVVLLNQEKLGGTNQLRNDLSKSIAGVLAQNLATAQEFVKAYINIMCLVKMYYENNLIMSSVLVRESLTGSTNNTVKIGQISIKPNVTPNTVLFNSKTGNLISVQGVSGLRGLGQEFQNPSSTIIANDVLSKYLIDQPFTSVTATYSLNGVSVPSDIVIKNTGTTYQCKELITVNVNLYKMGQSLSSGGDFINLIKNNLPDYTGLPDVLKNKVDFYLKLIENKANATVGPINVYGIKPIQDTAGDIKYVDDPSIGSMRIIKDYNS
jgi:hypothetical protein